MDMSWILDCVCSASPTSLVVAIATLLAAVVYYYSLRDRGMPPGPTGVPLLGYWPFIDTKECHRHFDDLKRKYGDVFSLRVTGTLYINLGSSKAVREAHIAKSDCFNKRTDVFCMMTDMFAGGIFTLNSEGWKVNRKFFIQILKERMSASIKDALSGSLYDSLNSSVGELKKLEGETVNIVEFLTSKCNTALRLTLFGENRMYEESVGEIIDSYGVVLSVFTPPNLLVTGNLARHLIFPFTPGYKVSMLHFRNMKKILYKIIDEHKSTFDEEHIRDIIDDYIKEGNVRRSKGDATAQYFTDKALMSTLVQILGDGVLTVAAFIGIAIKALITHPEEQDKIYKELVEVVGLDRQPTVEDKSRLTYTNAFILETIRTTDVFPFFPSMECTKETTIRGYRIPKGAITLVNFYSAHNDRDSYEQPQKFDPSRYIVAEGKKKPDPPITFGVGKRACIGESFTMLQVFLFVTTLVKNFHFSLPEGVDDSSFDLLMEGRMRILLKPRV